VHIPKELAIFSNSHTKYGQGAIASHNRHLGRCPKFWPLGTSVKVGQLDFQPQKWVTSWMPSQELGDSRRDCWTTERGGGVNQLLQCLNNYASFELFVETLNDDHNNAWK
jgi:hypothetical protein